MPKHVAFHNPYGVKQSCFNGPTSRTTGLSLDITYPVQLRVCLRRFDLDQSPSSCRNKEIRVFPSHKSWTKLFCY